jgi:hypothetical protein
MIETLRNLYLTMKAAIFGTSGDVAVAPKVAQVSGPASTAPEIPSEPAAATTELGDWSVHPYVDPTFEKIGRVYLDDGDLVIRSDRDSRGFLVVAEDLDAALTGGTGTVRLIDTLSSAGTAHLSTSGLALNLIIDQQLHTIPMQSLMRVMTGTNRKAPLFIPAEDVAPDLPPA